MPLQIRQDDMILRLVKDVNDIRSALRRTVANLPLFDISNENTPTTLTASQNNYVPGNFDVLRFSSTTPVTITGFRGGVKGRFIRLFNVGSYEITISHMSASSSLGNRVRSATGFDIILPAGGELVLYYDITNTEWRSSYASSADRISVRLRLAAPQTYANADAAFPAISWSTVVTDTGGFFNPASATLITIPETGWYDFHVQVVWDINATGFRVALTQDNVPYRPLCDTRNGINGGNVVQTIGRPLFRAKGSTMQVKLWQNSGGNLDVLVDDGSIVATTNTEFNVVKL